MKDYCTCGFRRVEQTFLSGGFVLCVTCREPLCCDVVPIEARVEPHAAELAIDEHFTCWPHSDSVANLAVCHRVAVR